MCGVFKTFTRRFPGLRHIKMPPNGTRVVVVCSYAPPFRAIPGESPSSGTEFRPPCWLGLAENQFAYTARDLGQMKNSEAAAVASVPAVKEQRLVVRAAHATSILLPVFCSCSFLQ